MKPRVFLKQDIVYQLLLIFIAVGTHPYLAGMVTPLAIAFCWKCFHQEKCKAYSAIMMGVIFLVFALLCAEFFGWFTGNSVTTGGFDFYSANLLSFINPMYGSALFRVLPSGSGQYEGFSYLGLGLIFSLIGLFFLSFYRKSSFYSRDYLFLMILLVAYFIFSLSNVIQIGPHRVTLFNIKHFPKLENILGVFRVPGRFIWPVFYFIQFFILIEIYDVFSFSLIKRGVILVLLLILQIFDNSYLIENVRERWADSTQASIKMANLPPLVMASHFKNETWFNLRKMNIEHLFVLHDIQNDGVIISLGYIALFNHITISEAKLARSPNAAVDQYYQEQYSHFLNGELLPNTLYVGLKKQKNYPQKYCSLLDGYVVCSMNSECH